LIEENGYSGEYAPAFSNKLHPCSVLIKINNTACKPFKLAHGSLSEKQYLHKFVKYRMAILIQILFVITLLT